MSTIPHFSDFPSISVSVKNSAEAENSILWLSDYANIHISFLSWNGFLKPNRIQTTKEILKLEKKDFDPKKVFSNTLLFQLSPIL